MRALVGTSGYNYPEWKGTFYPAKLPTAKMLPFYAERLPTVEINYTFYRMPNAKTVAAWVEATPPGFTFVLKAPKRITHDARLKFVEKPLMFFCDTAAGLGGKLGPLLFQLPPNFKKDTERLRDLLPLIPPAIRCAFEFRHASWFSDDVYDLLRGRNAALCIADTDDATTPLVPTADFGYFRLRDEGYSKKELTQWAGTVQDLGKGWTDAFVFFKHEEAGIGAKLAVEFGGILAAH
ncbi:MAG TPA: DUF72 domain-containing protein [Gemmatimonadales bacterium]|nr:DUF72 domain-containing protein [Gemmatimonadales bacterium]